MSGDHDNHRRVAFGEFVIDYDRGSLSRNGADVPLRPKSFAVLCHLAANGGRLVTKSELMEAVWGQVVVTEGSLTQCIIDVRRALGPDGRKIIRTVPRRGFVFDAPTHCSTGEGERRVTDAAVPAALPTKPVRTVIRHVWAPILLCVLVVLVALGAVRTQPGVPLEHPPGQDAAHEQFLLGRHLFHRRAPGDLAVAVRHFERAVELDPGHARAWTALAGAIAAQSGEELGGLEHRLDDEWHAIRTALELDPNLAEAHVRHARLLMRSGDNTGARAALECASSLAPDDPLVLVSKVNLALRDGRYEDAIAGLERAVHLEPLSAVYRNNLARALLTGGRFEEALDEFYLVKQLGGVAGVEFDIAQTLVLMGGSEEARRYLHALDDPLWRDQIAVLVEEPAQAADALARLQAEGSPRAEVLLAEIAAFREDRDRAFDHLESAVTAKLEHGAGERRRSLCGWLETSPFLRHLRNDQRWDYLVAELQTG